MGLLDDAIREHLDLKRQRGADPDEIERAERDALGPVRRGPEMLETDQLLADQPVAYDQEGEEVGWEEGYEDEFEEYEDVPDSEAKTALHRPVAAEPADLEEPQVAQERPGPQEAHEPADFDWAEEPLSAEERAAEPQSDRMPAEPPLEPPPPPHPAPVSPAPHQPDGPSGEETAEYDVEDALAEKPGTKEEDVLEETPEFLQDTPDHDRLWFEQRPPRDFDFNG